MLYFHNIKKKKKGSEKWKEYIFSAITFIFYVLLNLASDNMYM